jgi:hypothetical protein
MKPLRLLAVTLLASTCVATAAIACDSAKSGASATSATTVSATKANGRAPVVSADGGCSAEAMSLKSAAHASGCTAAMAAQCTPAMRAACEKNASVAAAMGCNMKGTAASAKDGCAAHAGTMATMSAGGKCDMKGAAAKGASCSMHGATTAGMEGCPHAKGATVNTSSAGMTCSAHMNAMAHDCSACQDWADCEQAVHALGAKTQVVSLKNGAMIVYTADSKSDIKALQSLVSKRNDTMVAALSAGSDKKLCDECKQLRGAMASGKLHRDVVNGERGCMTLSTSNDRDVVQRIRTMTGQPVALR